jgi:tetratricopeptide (TPR) repeat protein
MGCALTPCSAATPVDPSVNSPAPHSPESRAERELSKGLRLAEANKIDAAAAVFLRLTQDYPRLLEPYLQLAAMYQQQGNTRAAVDVLRAALKVHTAPPLLQERLGDLYLELAAEAYRSASENDHSTATAQRKYSALETLRSEPVEQ